MFGAKRLATKYISVNSHDKICLNGIGTNNIIQYFKRETKIFDDITNT